MDKTIKGLNIVAAALIIINLGLDLYDRFTNKKAPQNVNDGGNDNSIDENNDDDDTQDDKSEDNEG